MFSLRTKGKKLQNLTNILLDDLINKESFILKKKEIKKFKINKKKSWSRVQSQPALCSKS
jgi:hypothetical protein